MPELPEMQALAERLDAMLRGAAPRWITPFSFAALKTVQPPADALIGRPLDGVERRGKMLVFRSAELRLVVHLSQGGRIDVEQPAKRTKPKGALVRFAFDNDVGILVKEHGTERRAGWWILAPGDDGPLAALGPDALSEAFAAWLRTADDARHMHTVLRDQRTVAGIGRGYADDILHRARLSPYASLARMSDEERARLVDATSAVLRDAITAERARRGGLPAKLGDRFAVHGRAGLPCPRCGADLRRVSYESREVVYCPACQTGGKVLADRRMSRLIR